MKVPHLSALVTWRGRHSLPNVEVAATSTLPLLRRSLSLKPAALPSALRQQQSLFETVNLPGILTEPASLEKRRLGALADLEVCQAVLPTTMACHVHRGTHPSCKPSTQRRSYLVEAFPLKWMAASLIFTFF